MEYSYDFKQSYIDAVNTPCDINEHLPLLNMLAKLSNHVTEFGVRRGISTKAWFNNPVIVRAYDIEAYPEAVELFEHAAKANKDAKLIIQNTLAIENFEPTDLLFIDTFHVYYQVVGELKYAPMVRKFIAFHDTVTFGNTGEIGGKGILPAIHEFLDKNKEWVIMEHRTNNNGLMVLARRDIL